MVKANSVRYKGGYYWYYLINNVECLFVRSVKKIRQGMSLPYLLHKYIFYNVL